MLGQLCANHLRLLLRHRSILWLVALAPLLLHPLLAWSVGQFAWLSAMSARTPREPAVLRADPRIQELAGGRILCVDPGRSDADRRSAARLVTALQQTAPPPPPAARVPGLHVRELHAAQPGETLVRELVPLAVLLLLVLAMSWPALELTVGERRRGLGETFATLPVPPNTRTAAKLACTALIGLLVLVAHGTGITLAMLGSGAGVGSNTLSAPGLALASAGALSFVLLMGAVFLAIGAGSREESEAHAWSWLVFVLLAASLLPAVLEEDPPALLATLPGPGHALCLSAGLRGASVPPTVLVCLVASTVATFVLVRIVRRQLADVEGAFSR